MAGNRVFLDTSVLVSALLSPSGGSFYILSSLKSEYIFIINEYVFEEITRVLETKFSSRPELKNYLFMILGTSGILVPSSPSRKLIQNLKGVISKEDGPILAGAVDAKSHYLVTLGDEFFGDSAARFAQKHGILILKPKGFIKIHRERNS